MYILYELLELCYEQEKQILIQLQRYIVYITIKICNNIIKEKKEKMKMWNKKIYYNNIIQMNIMNNV